MKKVSVKKISCTLIFIMMFTVLFGTIPNVAHASGNIWYDKYIALDNEIGSDFYSSADSATFSWQESYILTSYMDLYNLTGSTSWLDKITTHVDKMLADTNDYDGDGYAGWDTPKISPVEIDNTGFETAASGDGTLPDQWIRFQSGSTTAYRTASDHYNGSYSVVLKTNGTLWQRLYQPLNNYVPNTRYNVRLFARTNGSAAKGMAYIFDRTANKILASVVVESIPWKYYTFDFVAPSASGHTLEMWLSHQDYTVTGGEAYFDDVMVSGRFPYMVHDALACQPIAEFIRLVKSTSSLQAAYLAKANSYQAFIENEVFPKWQSSSYLGNCYHVSGSEAYYTCPPNMDTIAGTAGDIQPHNGSLSMARLFMLMYDITNNSAYLDKAQMLTTYLKNRLSANGTAYNWHYSGSTGRAEDTNHGEIDMGTILEMYRHDQIINGTDMEKFTDTLTEVMWNGSLTAPSVRQYVDGSGDTTTFTRYGLNWADLAQFDSRVWKIYAEQYRNITPTMSLQMGILGQLMKWDPVKVANQGFEYKASSDSTLPARWTRWNSSSATAYLDAANKYSGNYGLTIKANGVSWMRLYQTWSEWTPSATYVVTFNGKTDGSAAGGQIFVRDDTTATTLGYLNFSNTSWEEMSFTFTAPANTTDAVKISIGNQDYTVANGKAYYDNVTIKRVGDSW